MTSTRLIEKEEEVGKGFFERNKGREEKRGGGGGGCAVSEEEAERVRGEERARI